jgi:hypothetical protein
MKTENSNINKDTGSVLIEVILATIIFMIVSVIALSTIENQRFALSDLAAKVITLYENESDIEDNSVSGYTHQQGTSSVQTSFLTPCLIKSVSNQFPFSVLSVDPAVLKALAGNCAGYMDENAFSSPLVLNTNPSLFSNLATIKTGASTSAPNPSFSSVDVFGGYAYIGASSTDGYNFLIAQLAYPGFDHPIPASLVSRLQMPPVHAVSIGGKYAYIGVEGTSSQFEVIDVHDPAVPVIIATRTLPNVSGVYPSAISIFYYAQRVYIGTHRTAGNEFHVFDVTAPNNPRWLGSIELNHNINDIVVSGKYAFLATSGNTSDVMVLNIDNPAHISILSKLTFIGTEDTTKAFLLGSTLFIGRIKGISPAHPEFVMINVSDPALPSVVASTSIATTVTGIRVVGTHALIATMSGLLAIPISENNHFDSLVSVSKNALIALDDENGIAYSLTSGNLSTIATINHQK